MTILRRGQFLSPNIAFNVDRIKYYNILKLLKKLQMKRNYNIQRNKIYKLLSEKMKTNSKKIVNLLVGFY